MECVEGVAYLYSPNGDVAYCVAPSYVQTVDISTWHGALDEFLYLADRLPTYVVAGGAIVGLVVLLLAAYVVKALMS